MFSLYFLLFYSPVNIFGCTALLPLHINTMYGCYYLSKLRDLCAG